MGTYLLSFFVGIEKDKYEEYITPTEQARICDDIRYKLCKFSGGYTEQDTRGGWVNSSGAVIEERAKRWDVLHTFYPPITEFAINQMTASIADDIKLLAGQSAVLYTITPVISGMSRAQS